MKKQFINLSFNKIEEARHILTTYIVQNSFIRNLKFSKICQTASELTQVLTFIKLILTQ